MKKNKLLALLTLLPLSTLTTVAVVSCNQESKINDNKENDKETPTLINLSKGDIKIAQKELNKVFDLINNKTFSLPNSSTSEGNDIEEFIKNWNLSSNPDEDVTHLIAMTLGDEFKNLIGFKTSEKQENEYTSKIHVKQINKLSTEITEGQDSVNVSVTLFIPRENKTDPAVEKIVSFTVNNLSAKKPKSEESLKKEFDELIIKLQSKPYQAKDFDNNDHLQYTTSNFMTKYDKLLNLYSDVHTISNRDKKSTLLSLMKDELKTDLGEFTVINVLLAEQPTADATEIKLKITLQIPKNSSESNFNVEPKNVILTVSNLGNLQLEKEQQLFNFILSSVEKSTIYNAKAKSSTEKYTVEEYLNLINALPKSTDFQNVDNTQAFLNLLDHNIDPQKVADLFTTHLIVSDVKKSLAAQYENDKTLKLTLTFSFKTTTNQIIGRIEKTITIKNLQNEEETVVVDHQKVFDEFVKTYFPNNKEFTLVGAPKTAVFLKDKIEEINSSSLTDEQKTTAFKKLIESNFRSAFDLNNDILIKRLVINTTDVKTSTTELVATITLKYINSNNTTSITDKEISIKFNGFDIVEEAETPAEENKLNEIATIISNSTGYAINDSSIKVTGFYKAFEDDLYKNDGESFVSHTDTEKTTSLLSLIENKLGTDLKGANIIIYKPSTTVADNSKTSFTFNVDLKLDGKELSTTLTLTGFASDTPSTETPVNKNQTVLNALKREEGWSAKTKSDSSKYSTKEFYKKSFEDKRYVGEGYDAQDLGYSVIIQCLEDGFQTALADAEIVSFLIGNDNNFNKDHMTYELTVRFPDSNENHLINLKIKNLLPVTQ